jgi:glycosyltransferase involved in cell wall biosynthesis
LRRVTSSAKRRRSRLVVALTFPVTPPRGGGQVRVYNLYRELARRFEVDVISLGLPGTHSVELDLAPGLRELRIPKSPEHAALELELERAVGTVVTDVAMCRLYRHTPAFVDAIRCSARGATAVVASHPYSFWAIRDATDIPVWYEAQDVEVALKAEVLDGGEVARELLVDVEQVERRCCEEAQLVWSCSAEDRDELARRYMIAMNKMLVVPNGVALDELRFSSPTARAELKRRLRMDRPLAVFLASWHPPNIVGARMLVRLAERTPDVDFLIVGSVGDALGDRELPPNVHLTGSVSPEFKQAALAVADVALNPVTTGSGTNIKMLDYFGSGLPVISTPFGARGLGVRPDEHYLAAELGRFGAALAGLVDAPSEMVENLANAALAVVRKKLSWPVIAAELLDELQRRGLAG